MTRSIIHKSWL